MVGALVLSSLGGLWLWAPWAMGTNRRDTYRSGWFKALITSGLTLCALVIGLQYQLVMLLPWVMAMMLISVVDMHHQSVQVRDLGIMTLMGLPVVLVHPILPLLMTGAFVFLGLMALKFSLKAMYKQDALGGADIWVILTILMALGGRPALVAVYIGVIVSAIYGLYLIIFKHKHRTSSLPFIPFLTGGVIVSIFFSDAILTASNIIQFL
jgi:prepilin signal peptidase PulO-like enzyme (type II secretory pathway)